MKIAPDVENMMWIVAESADPQAVADFEARFPQLRYELSKRIDMVRKLKASGKLARSEASIPRFVPPPRFSSPFGSRTRLSIAAIALTALAFGSFYGTKMYMATSQPKKAPELPSVIYAPLEGSPNNQTDPASGQKTAPEKPSETGIVPPDDEPAPIASWAKPQNVRFEKIGLKNAVKAIAAQSGLKVDMPPDMPNEDIVVDYQGMTPIDILQDMASRFGFTVFDQGEGSVLIIPVREEGGQEGDLPTHKPFQPTNTSPAGRR